MVLEYLETFHGRGSTASRPQPLQGGSLLFTIQFPDIPEAIAPLS